MPKGYNKNGLNISRFQKGHIGYWVGKKRLPFTKVHKDKISESHKGDKNPSYGKLGENSAKWIKDRTKLKKTDHRANTMNWEWKRKCKERDSYLCRLVNETCKDQLEVHHILSYTKYPELRYEINNGITLCHHHHPRKKTEETRLSTYFKELING